MVDLITQFVLIGGSLLWIGCGILVYGFLCYYNRTVWHTLGFDKRTRAFFIITAISGPIGLISFLEFYMGERKFYQKYPVVDPPKLGLAFDWKLYPPTTHKKVS